MQKLVLFGDSITSGFKAGQLHPTLDHLITADLTDQTVEDIQIINEGVLGDTTKEGVKRIDQAVLAKKPDIVSIFFGANDMSEDRFVTKEQFGENLVTMIQKIGKEKVILITPPYANAVCNPDRPLARIFEYVEKARAVAKEQQVPLINLYHAMMVMPEPDNLLQDDGLHFSEQGYELLAALITKELKSYLKLKEH